MIKIFGDKKITIRKLALSDLKRAKEFQEYINSLVEEDAMILMDKKVSVKEEKVALTGKLNEIRKRERVTLVVEDGKKIVGMVSVSLEKGRSRHMGKYGIHIRNGYRGMGLGNFLTGEIINLAKKELKGLKIIKLEVFCDNGPAIKIYRKFGFKKVARIPDELQYKGKLVAHLVMLKYL